MNFIEFEKSIINKVDNAYLINGGEGYLTQKALKLIEQQLNINLPELNKTIFTDESENSAFDIVSCCEALPFCSEKRLVIVNDFFIHKNENAKKIIESYLKNPCFSTCLVFYSPNKSEFFTSLEKLSGLTLVECDKLTNEQVAKLSEDLIKNAELNFSIEAKKKLYDYCNYSITKISTELNKLKSIFNNSNVISESDIEQNIVKDIEYVVFDLTHAISKKQNDKAYILLETMLNSKEQPASIISIISNHFRRLFLISRSNVSSNELATLLGIKEYAISKYKEQIKYFTQKELKEIFDLCIDTEYKLKSGVMNPKIAVNYLLSNILK